ncbi:Qnr family pentapeptide repeat protein [Salmonella enterica subsp. enterica]|nr:Qnr family pentapeptide repeat protein [Salmonella enterica subsp. enterica serovar Poona]HAC7072458.1 Qnr family pentapeptide repeat protein [Salmonella enterica]EBW2885991.1 Qnr family pentapeptide repeat protein [Salmonella enterica subsp. enterica serovar Poona]ECD3709412.1 Qnr family pentapeptide repeat protein [Salmonella enterica subsp. enterica serovar Poona]ECG6029384.1 Qnr family pentapeptide repeat protein [Salmonella enterica subsp. enterica serovar Poona]
MKILNYEDQKFTLNQFTGEKISGVNFYSCDFSETDLTETHFIDCHFWHPDKQVGCDFSGATLKEASFANCDLTMSIFKNADLFGIEIRDCRAMGCNFRQAKFMKKISPRLWMCSAFITKSNLSYADFSGAILEECELWENLWNGTIVTGANFSGSDLSGGNFSSFNWRSADVTNCDLRRAVMGELDIRRTNLEGVKIDYEQASSLMADLGITVTE